MDEIVIFFNPIVPTRVPVSTRVPVIWFGLTLIFPRLKVMNVYVLYNDIEMHS